jgi:hypothetical protein
MSNTTDRGPLFWVITESEEAYGPYDTYAHAYHFAWENLGFDGWVVTET